MKLLVFSDIHGNVYALRSMIRLLPKLDYDAMVFLGDIFGYYYWQKECLRILRSMTNLIWLKGNHDAYASMAYGKKEREHELVKSFGHSYANLSNRFTMEEMRFLSFLPSHAKATLHGQRVGFFHGRPADNLEGRFYPDSEAESLEFCDYDLVFLGHTHCKIDKMLGNVRIVSPGSLGQPRDGRGYGFAIFDTYMRKCEYINVNVDADILRKEIEEKDAGLQKLIEVLAREECK